MNGIYGCELNGNSSIGMEIPPLEPISFGIGNRDVDQTNSVN